MQKKIKEEKISLAKDIMSDNTFMVIVDYKGLNAKGMSAFRRTLKSKGANMKIFKNNLIKRAVNETKDEFKGLNDFFIGQTALSYSKDPVALSNILVNFSKENEAVKIKGGFFEGKIIDINMIENLAKLGSLEEVRAKFVGLLQAPASTLARLLKIASEKEGVFNS